MSKKKAEKQPQELPQETHSSRMIGSTEELISLVSTAAKLELLSELIRKDLYFFDMTRVKKFYDRYTFFSISLPVVVLILRILNLVPFWVNFVSTFNVMFFLGLSYCYVWVLKETSLALKIAKKMIDDGFDELMKGVFIPPRLIKLGDSEGYEADELHKAFKRAELGSAWNRWFVGCTGGLTDDGKTIVWKHDVDNFLAGAPNLD